MVTCTIDPVYQSVSQNLESAQIYFLKEDDPDPAQAHDLRARLFDMEGIALSKYESSMSRSKRSLLVFERCPTNPDRKLA